MRCKRVDGSVVGEKAWRDQLQSHPVFMGRDDTVHSSTFSTLSTLFPGEYVLPGKGKMRSGFSE